MLRPKNLLQPAHRYPADPRVIFILAISVFSSFTAIVMSRAPGSLNEAVPEWGIFLWSLGLGVGSLLAMIGLEKDNINGIIIEQVGLVMVGVAALFYSAIAFWVIGVDAGQPVNIILGWGVACLLRWVQLQLLLRQIQRKKLLAEAEELASQIIDSATQTSNPDSGQ